MIEFDKKELDMLDKLKDNLDTYIKHRIIIIETIAKMFYSIIEHTMKIDENTNQTLKLSYDIISDVKIFINEQGILIYIKTDAHLDKLGYRKEDELWVKSITN